MNNNKEKEKTVSSIINSNLSKLNVSEEDILLINNLVSSYYRKRIGVSNSAPETMASAFLWVYSKSSFLWEGDKKWSLQSLASLFNANPKTAGDVASKILKTLKIRLWDKRFCRQDVMKGSPFEKYVMTTSGMIVPKEMLEKFSRGSFGVNNTKEDYFDEAMDYLEEDEEEKAIEYLNKALALDEKYIEAISELGLIYFDENISKSLEYYKKAVELSKKELGGEWPKDLEWAVSKNRPYMMAIQGLGLTNWRQNNVEDAKELFKLLLDMNPNDNQGIRYCMAALYRGLTWEEFGKIEDHCAKKGEYNEVDILLKEQNELYSFWKSPEDNKDEQ